MKKKFIKLIEDHNGAYDYWKELRLRSKTLIHFDAHFDFNFLPAKPPLQTLEEARGKEDLIRQCSDNVTYAELEKDERSLTNIGNYIYPAIRDGIVKYFYWVIPGGPDQLTKASDNVKRMLTKIRRKDPFGQSKIVRKRNALQTKIYGRDLYITTLDGLEAGLKNAIIDIDIDFLTTGTIQKSGSFIDAGRRFPWIWPRDLVKAIKNKKIRYDCVTIAYSVNGGFTPLMYKFFGDELAFYLNDDPGKLNAFISKRNAALKLFYNGKTAAAFKIASHLLSDIDTVGIDRSLIKKLKAHVNFMLFRMRAKTGLKNERVKYYQTCVRLDGTYRAKDNNYGPLFLRRKKALKKAEKEFRLILEADKGNFNPLLGLGKVYIRKKDPDKAFLYLRRAYRAAPENKEVLFHLGKAEDMRGNYKTAINYLKACLEKDKFHRNAMFLLGDIYVKVGGIDSALRVYSNAYKYRTGIVSKYKLFKFIKGIDVPSAHRDWIGREIRSYKNLRDNFQSMMNRMPSSERKRALSRHIKKTDREIKGIQV